MNIFDNDLVPSVFYDGLDDYGGMVNKAMSGYNIALYEEGCMTVTEEEFVFDSNMNKELKDVIQQCAQLSIQE